MSGHVTDVTDVTDGRPGDGPTLPDADREVGPLVFVGGGEWTVGADFDAELVRRSEGAVVVLPTAAAYEHPERAVAQAERWFAQLGARVVPCMVLTRADASDEALASIVRSARFVYLSGGSPLHLRSVLKDSPVLHALMHAWHHGAIVAGSSAGAMALCDPMVDPRGGALTVGLGLVRDVAVSPHYAGKITPRLERTLALSRGEVAVAAVAERTALVREPDGVWRILGDGEVEVFVDGRATGLTALAGRPIS